MNAKRLPFLAAAAIAMALSACATVPGTPGVTEADRVAVFKGMNGHWVFDKVREYLQESAILVPAPEPRNPDRMLRYRQASSTEILAASEEEGRVAARWELKENAGSAFPLRQSGAWKRMSISAPEPVVLQYLVTFEEVAGGMQIDLSIASPDGADADRLYYTRFWKFMTGRWK
jgi:hypothetical protein